MLPEARLFETFFVKHYSAPAPPSQFTHQKQFFLQDLLYFSWAILHFAPILQTPRKFNFRRFLGFC